VPCEAKFGLGRATRLSTTPHRSSRHSVPPKRKAQPTNHPVLGFSVEIPERVAAEPHIDPGDRCIAGEIVAAEDHAASQVCGEDVAAVDELEVPFPVGLGQPARLGFGVAGLPSVVQSILVQVGGVDLEPLRMMRPSTSSGHIMRTESAAHFLGQQHRRRVLGGLVTTAY
jgi:hypothetical protein